MPLSFPSRRFLVLLSLAAGGIGSLTLLPLSLLAERPGWAARDQSPQDSPAAARPDLALGFRVEDFAGAAAGASPVVARVYTALAQPAEEGQTPYETVALAQVNGLLSSKDVPQREKLAVAQKILVAVLHWHRVHRVSIPDSAQTEKDLADRLFQVRQNYLRTLTAEAEKDRSWGDVLFLAKQLRAAYPGNTTIQTQIAGTQIQYAHFLLKGEKYSQVRDLLRDIGQILPNNSRTRELEQQLRQAAQKLREQAVALTDKSKAVAQLQEALVLWPVLPGLRDDLLKLQGKFPILRVAVPQLPEYLSPARAFTDVEKQTVELLFEGLLRSNYDSGTGQQYEPVLAADFPEILPSGYRFQLTPEARWSTGEQITAEDIRHTVNLLPRAHLPGGTGVWTELLKPPQLVEGRPLQVSFERRQARFDPLALFSFRLLPQMFQGKPLLAADSVDFAKAPRGSGPYQYQGRKQEGSLTWAMFTANPYYSRPERPQQPFVREIRLAVPPDPAEAFQDPQQPFQLLLGLTEEQLALLKVRGLPPARTVTNRRVYFLAPNHRREALKKRELRQALAAALQRQQLLDHCFRGKDPAYQWLEATGASLGVAVDFLRETPGTFHRPLNGPFPAASWALAPAARVPADLYDPERARSLLGRAAVPGQTLTLTLKYPNDDPRVEQACWEMVAQWTKTASAAKVSLKVQFLPRSPHELQEDLQRGDYDLAYCHWDYDSEFYWLWPLFDPRPEALAAGGSNFLGYDNDALLVSLLRSQMSQVDFRHVQAVNRDIHSHLYERMPLIPLWQIDTHYVVHPDLQPVRIDPLTIFPHVAEWSLKSGT